MAQRTYRSYSRTENRYESEGSAARRLQEVPAYTPEREERSRQRQKQHNARIRHANWKNFIYTVAVLAVTGVLFTFCVQYLQLRTTTQAHASQVAALQSDLSSLTLQNDEEEVKINTNIDYNQIYETAVNELGMVYPGAGQVITYTNPESEYVKQYQDIPTAK